MFIDSHRFQQILINLYDLYDFNGFLLFFIDLSGSGARMFGGLCWPVAPCGNRLDPLYIKISDSGGPDLEAWCLDVWMLKDWNGLG